MSTIMPICICTETLAFRWNCCTVEESKFRLAYAVSDEDGGRLVEEDLGNPILPTSRSEFNPEGQPEECVLTLNFMAVTR